MARLTWLGRESLLLSGTDHVAWVKTIVLEFFFPGRANNGVKGPLMATSVSFACALVNCPVCDGQSQLDGVPK